MWYQKWEQMTKKKRGSYSFFLRGTNDLKSIILRFRFGRETDLKIALSEKVNEKYWDKNKGCIKTNSSFYEKNALELRLNQIKFSIDKAMDSMRDSDDYTSDWLKNTVENSNVSIEENNYFLTDELEAYKNNLRVRYKNGVQGVAVTTLRNYNTTKMRIVKYEKWIGHKIRLTDLDFEFHKNYTAFASNVLGLAQNSIGKDINQVKTICYDARDRGIAINPNVFSRRFNAPSEKTIFTTLTPDELKVIAEYKGLNYLENARDWLIIGCWTGCRVGDLMSLTEKNVIDYKDTRIIKYTQRKTGKTVALPIHPQVIEILDKNGGKFPRPISDVNFNKYIKKVALKQGFVQPIMGSRQNPKTHKKEVGIFEKWELIRSHICRRSFATNHYHILPNKLIMAATAHSSEKMLLRYIGETETDHIDAYLDVWK